MFKIFQSFLSTLILHKITVADTQFKFLTGKVAQEEGLQEVLSKYVGKKPKEELTTRFKTIMFDIAKYQSEDQLPQKYCTPRSTYIREVDKRKLIPLPLVLRNVTKYDGIYFNNKVRGT